MNKTKQKIIKLLESTDRNGILSLIEYLVKSDFFETPASSRHHGCYYGGLASHSLRVYELLTEYTKRFEFRVKDSTNIIAALLHDVCKIDAYVRTIADDGWTYNRDKDKGHSLLSLCRVKKFIKITELEEMMIKYHMGVYGLLEFDERQGEYTLRNESMANAWYHHPIVKVMYFCDEIAVLEEKTKVK